ncbi:hypothetical protein C3L33_02972, partial [Rhododendron williamsianum]
TWMDDAEDLCNIEGDGDGDGRNSSGVSSSTSGEAADIILWNLAADIILWKQWHVSCGIIVVATIAWLLVERSGLSFLSLCSDVMLFLIVLLFLQANFAVFRHEKLPKLPKLVLSEEIVNNGAASFRLKVNHALLMGHDITFGKDFTLFFKVSESHLYKMREL